MAISVISDHVDGAVNKLNSQLKIVNEWFKYNKLSLNLNKTEYMLFGTKPKLQQLPSEAVVQDEHVISKTKKIFGGQT